MDAFMEPEGCEFFCEDCAPDGATAYSDGGGESDCPEHCDKCHCPLGNPLTTAGVRYVLEAIAEKLGQLDAELMREGTWPKDWWYAGDIAAACVEDWAEDLQDYALDDAQRMLVDSFLDRVTGLRVRQLRGKD